MRPIPAVIITMAGLGTRFRAAGFTEPKFRIAVRGKTLFHWSLESLGNFLGPATRVVFVALKAHAAGRFIATSCPDLGIARYDVVEVDAPTDGQATTALIGTRALDDPDTPILIYNIDTRVEPRHLHPDQMRGDGWIPCFPGRGEGWSFVRTDADGRALEVREKRRISPHATIGLYAFDSARLYADLYARYYAGGGNLERSERYVAPMYNQLIRDGGAVYISELPADAVQPIGTPEELDVFAHTPGIRAGA